MFKPSHPARHRATRRGASAAIQHILSLAFWPCKAAKAGHPNLLSGLLLR
ncbi:hypothetical protein JYT60_00370 [bacterium AH-315-C08]|nr:hypothetical protein [bacterium AH-315-C08]